MAALPLAGACLSVAGGFWTACTQTGSSLLLVLLCMLLYTEAEIPCLCHRQRCVRLAQGHAPQFHRASSCCEAATEAGRCTLVAANYRKALQLATTTSTPALASCTLTLGVVAVVAEGLAKVPLLRIDLVFCCFSSCFSLVTDAAGAGVAMRLPLLRTFVGVAVFSGPSPTQG